MGELRDSELKELYKEYCNTFNNEQIVLGEGCTFSPLVIVGEAPGKDEVLQGKPFVGAAGKNLKEFMELIGLSREEVFITNAIKYRLSRINERTNRVVNRPATKFDILSNQKWLHKEIKLLQPKIIVTLGNVPLKSVLNNFNSSVGSMHGTLQECSIEGHKYNLFPLYHPASIIYNRSLLETYNRDVLNLKEEIGNINIH